MKVTSKRTDKAQDRSLRAGTKPVQQLHQNAQNITGTVLNLERKIHELDAGKVAGNTNMHASYWLYDCSSAAVLALCIPDYVLSNGSNPCWL